MNITYDPEADAVYISIKRAPVHRTEEIDVHTIADIDASGELIGLELLFVKQRKPDLLSVLKIE